MPHKAAFGRRGGAYARAINGGAQGAPRHHAGAPGGTGASLFNGRFVKAQYINSARPPGLFNPLTVSLSGPFCGPLSSMVELMACSLYVA